MKKLLNKKNFFLSVLFSLLSATTSFGAEKVYIDINSPGGSRLPIAIQDLIAYEGVKPIDLDKVNAGFRSTLSKDLDFSGFFDILNKDSFLEAPSAGIKKSETNFYNWRVIGAEIVVKGIVNVRIDRFYLTIRVYDTLKEDTILAKRYSGYVHDPRNVAHLLADDLMEVLTGVRGVFSTRIAFVSPAGGNKEIYIADYDGSNVEQITNNGSINLSPKWSPDSQKLIYTSYYKGRPQLFETDLRSNDTRRLSYKNGLNISGRWSPVGETIALALSIDGNSEIYTIDRASLEYTRLTNSWALDVSPAWSPDSKHIAFTSNRAGNPHIYVINSKKAKGFQKPERVTFEGKYNSNPEWSPNGEWIVYEGLHKGTFQVWKVRPDGSDATMLTTEGNNEMPSWSPDNRFIVYSSGKGLAQSLYIMRADGTGKRKIETGVGMEQMPHWSPYPKN